MEVRESEKGKCMQKDRRWQTVFAGERCQAKRTTRTLAGFDVRRPFILITTANMITVCGTLAKWSKRRSKSRKGEREREREWTPSAASLPEKPSIWPSVAVLLLDVSLVTVTALPLRHDYIYYSELSLLDGSVAWKAASMEQSAIYNRDVLGRSALQPPPLTPTATLFGYFFQSTEAFTKVRLLG